MTADSAVSSWYAFCIICCGRSKMYIDDREGARKWQLPQQPKNIWPLAILSWYTFSLNLFGYASDITNGLVQAIS